MPSKPDPSDGSYSPNQKGRLSEDPGDGARNSFAAEKEREGAAPRPNPSRIRAKAPRALPSWAAELLASTDPIKP